jgi:hypothetical protein
MYWFIYNNDIKNKHLPTKKIIIPYDVRHYRTKQ